MKAVLRERIFLEVDKSLEERVRKALTYTVPVRISMTETRYVKVFDFKVVNERTLSIPIGRTDLIPTTHEVTDRRIYNLEDFHIKPGITLRDSQQKIYDTVEDNCIINAGCSFGKTFTALSLVEKLGQKTLIIVHTLKLLEQWVKEVRKVLGITPGILADGKFEIDNPICIGTNQTLGNKKDPKLYSEFGLVCVDEAHHIPAKTFNSIINKFRARYKIGLTATLKRNDSKQFLITNYITHSNVIKPDTENSLVPYIIGIKTGITMPPGYSWQARVTKLIENPDYISLLYQIISNQINKGHKVLTIGNRLAILKSLHYLLNANNYKNGIIVGDTDAEEIISGMLKGDIDSITGSTQIMSEGISVNNLSCLVLGTPIASDITLEQVIGRVIRIYEDKLQPVVFDPVLKGKTGRAQWLKRLDYYTKMQYRVHMVDI